MRFFRSSVKSTGNRISARRNGVGSTRRLSVEPLEHRRMLSVNPAIPLSSDPLATVEAMETQMVSGAESTMMVPAGESLGVTVRYTTSDNEPTLTTLGLRIHFDSSYLTYGQIDDLLSFGLIANPSLPTADAEDFDNDPNTDTFVLLGWSDIMGNWPGGTLPADLFTAQFTAAEGLAEGASTQIRFSTSDTTFGYGFESTPIDVSIARPSNLDIDLDGDARPSTDGILLMRYLFGFTDQTLVDGAINPEGGRTDPAEIVDYLDGQQTKMLDVDGDGDARPSTDGILLMRYLFGFSGQTMIEGVVNTAGTRTTAAEIVSFLDGCNPEVTTPARDSAALSNIQTVYSDPEVQTVQPNDPVSIEVKYTTTPLDDTLTTLGLRIHYNSTLLSSTSVDNLLEDSLISTPSPPMPDTADFDNDPETDTYLLIAWSDVMSNWPGASTPLPATLLRANFTTESAFVDGTTSINFSTSDTTFGWGFSSTSAEINVQTFDPPTAVAGGPYEISEGESLTLDGSASSDPDGVIALYEWDLDNDGEYDDASGANPVVSWSTLSDLSLSTNGTTEAIGLRVEDGNGQVDTNSSTLTILNLAPTVDVGTDASIQEGATFTRSGLFTDPGLDIWTATVDFGDGSGVQTLALNADKTFELVHDFPQGRDSYTVTVTVDDSDGGLGEGSFAVNVDIPEQQVTPNPISQTLTFDQTPGDDIISFDVVYTTLPADATLTGLGLRMHFDSSKLSLDTMTNVFDDNLFQQQGPLADTADFDQDPATDQFFLIAWTDITFKWPGTLPAVLYTANFTAPTAQAGSTTVNFTAASRSPGWSFSGTSATVEFENRPIANAGGPYLVDEGGSIELDASVSTDLDQSDDSLLYEWDLDDDGIFGETGTDATHGDELGIHPIFLTAGLDDTDSLPVVVRVTDEDGFIDPSSSIVTIENVAPSVDAGPDVTMNEGDALSLIGSFVDPGPDTWTATVDYGDGSEIQTLALNTDKTFDLDHVYPESGTFTVTVTVEDDDGDTNEDTVLVTVQNIAPGVDAGLDATLDEGTTFTQSGSFTDPGLDTWTATVDYGDGSGVQTLTLNADKTFDLDHVYSNNGTFTIAVTIEDSDAEMGTDTVEVIVSNVAPTIDAGPDVTITEAYRFENVGSFQDPGDDTWTATVDYGDGSGVQTLALNEDKTFQLDHQYDIESTTAFTVTVTITDSDGEIGADTVEVLVLPETNLDVDGNGVADALSDGIIILRYLFGFEGDSLVDPAAQGATRTDPAEIIQYLDAGRGNMLDVDANGVNDALSDGMIILNYLFGFVDDSLVNEDVLGTDPPAQRTDPAEIIAFLDPWNPSATQGSPIPLASPDAVSGPNLNDAALDDLATDASTLSRSNLSIPDDVYSALAYETTSEPSSSSTESTESTEQAQIPLLTTDDA